MKKSTLLLGVAVIALAFTSCKKDEKEWQGDKAVDSYSVYVDSIEKVTIDETTDWDQIDAGYELRMNEAEASLANSQDSIKAQERMLLAREKYELLKAKRVVAVATPAPSSKQQLRNALFGEGKIGDDMSFAWVNAANIHEVYQSFIHTAENNKDSYTREDWDEIKLMYEALDSRKNTVENEGLSKEDNRKIAGLKFKFAPMLKVNRMGEKTAEMKEAKE